MSMIRSMIRGSGASGDAYSEWQSITTESGSSPSSTAFTLSSDQDGFILYVNDLLEDRPAGLLKFTINVDSTDYTLIAAPYQSYLFHCGGVSKSVKIACEEMDGTGVEFSVSICKARMPLQYVDTDALFVTGTVHSDWNYPLEWTPTTYRVTMQADGQWLAIDGTSWTKQIIVWIRERSGSNVSPVQAIVCVPGRVTPFFVQGREVAVMTLDGIDVPIMAPFDTDINTTTASDVLDIDDFVPNERSPIEVSTGGEFDAAIADLQDGDDIVVSASMTITNISLSNLAKSFRIRSSTGDPDDVTITGAFSITGSNTDVTVYMSGIDWKSSYAGIPFQSSIINWRLTRCNFTKTGGTTANIWEWNQGGASYSRNFKAFRCNATTTNAGYVSDVWNFRMPATGTAHLIACNGSVAGTASNSNIVTNHNENGSLYVWGGEYSDPGNNGPAITADAPGSPIILVGIYCHDGATANGFRVGSHPLHMVFGCEIRDLGDSNACWVSYRSIGNRITTGGGNLLYFVLDDDTEIISFVGNVVIHPNNTGTFLYLQADWWVVAGNQFRLDAGLDSGDGNAFSRAIDVRVESDYTSGDAGVQWMLCNWSRSASSNYWRNVDQTGVCVCLGNVASSLDGGTSTINAKNFLFDGNLTSGSIGNSVAGTGTNFRNSVTPIRNKSTEAFDEGTEFDAEGTPLSGGQFEWATFTSGLSAPNPQTLRDRMPFDMGLMDAFGGSLLDHGDRFTLGPIPIRERVDAVGLYPVRG